MKVLKLCIFIVCVLLTSLSAVTFVEAANISSYSNQLGDSGPNQFANHTYRFTPVVDVGGSAYIDIVLPSDFSFTSATSTFAERNVELYIDGSPRTAATTSAPGVDAVAINRGLPNSVRYTLAPDAAISAGSRYELRIGNHTSNTLGAMVSVSSTTGTTTTEADIEPIRNPATLGKHTIAMSIVDGVEVADTDFVVYINEKVTVPADTTEEIPPFRFNGAPTSTVGGTTLSVEISLETDELAVCRYATASGTPYASMVDVFGNTGQLQHSSVVTVTPGTLAQYFVRCIDDEGNFNIDDFLIAFTVNEQPTGTANTDGSTSGDGTGSGNDGTGSGDGGGGTTGSADGEAPIQGGSSGSGGSGGGGGGGSGDDSGDDGGGGFENSDGPFESGDARIIISGTAFPGADITILADGQVADRATANSRGEYSITIDGIARGAYTFGVYAEDDNNVRSSTFSTSFTVSGARASRLSNVNIPPTILVTPDPAEPGELVTISGFALPDATVTIETGREGGADVQTITAITDSDGEWTTTLDTTGFRRDTYEVRARADI